MGPQSFLTRWRDAVRPLTSPKALDAEAVSQQRLQRRLILFTLLLIPVCAAGYFVYDYLTNSAIRARTSYEEGMKQLRPGAYGDAIYHFTRSIEMAPNDPGSFLWRGVALHNMNQRDLALEDLARALELDPQLTRAHEERGRIYLENHDSERALQEFSKSISIRPTTDGYYQRGLLYESLGQHAQAIADFDKAIAEMPNAPYAYRARAAAKANLGDQEGAARDRDAATRIERHP